MKIHKETDQDPPIKNGCVQSKSSAMQLGQRSITTINCLARAHDFKIVPNDDLSEKEMTCTL